MVEGQTYHTGKPYTDKKFVDSYNISEKNGKTIFDKGLARFGSGRDALYFHYDGCGGPMPYKPKLHLVSRFGGENIENTVEAMTAPPGYIREIKSDEGVVLYLLSGYSNLTLFNNYQWIHVLIGKQTDGQFVKFFDTINLKKQYFPDVIPRNVNFSDCIVRGDTIIVKFKYTDHDENKSSATSGEFWFKWDSNAQWFGIEQITL